MSATPGDTIAALASGAGRAGVGVIRVSGPAVPEIAAKLIGELPAPRRVRVCGFHDREGIAIDHGVALYFAAPASFTGEHVLELQGHGSPVLVDMLLARLLELGARLADPGEFSRHAFLNDKLSLNEAEAIADAIDAGSGAAARAGAGTPFHRLMMGITDRQFRTAPETEWCDDLDWYKSPPQARTGMRSAVMHPASDSACGALLHTRALLADEPDGQSLEALDVALNGPGGGIHP